MERTRRRKGKETVERAYAVTSLPPERADAVRLLEIWRGHWRIENGLHWVRDVVFGEDHSQVRTGSAPQLLAALRNLVIGMLRLGWREKHIGGTSPLRLETLGNAGPHRPARQQLKDLGRHDQGRDPAQGPLRCRNVRTAASDQLQSPMVRDHRRRSRPVYPSCKICSACQVVNKALKREPRWTCANCGVEHDRNENAARNLLKIALLAVGENVLLPDGEALADGHSTNGETGPVEGRTKPRTGVNTQYALAI